LNPEKYPVAISAKSKNIFHVREGKIKRGILNNSLNLAFIEEKNSFSAHEQIPKNHPSVYPDLPGGSPEFRCTDQQLPGKFPQY